MLVRRPLRLFVEAAAADSILSDARVMVGPGYLAIDAASSTDDPGLLAYVQRFMRERLRASEFHPDAWPVAVVRNPADTHGRLAAVAGDK